MPETTTLGLDLGPNSIGWALIRSDAEGNAAGIIGCGVRVFPEGVDRTPQGSEQSKNESRRLARAARRIHQRRNRRRNWMRERLVAAGLAPSDESEWAAWLRLNPYALRSRGLDHPLTPHEFGRALYHLVQRRGFKSNRKTDNPKEDEGTVKPAIHHLAGEIEKAGCRTLGEYLFKMQESGTRIRGRHTGREMYEQEFNRLWHVQSQHHPDLLPDDLRKELEWPIFFQRPLKIQKHLVGECEYERGKKRSPRGTWYAQQFALLQTINNLRITDTRTGEIRELTPEEREVILDELQPKEKRTFDQLRKALLKKLEIPETAYRFNLEERADRKHLWGNRTEAALRKVLGKRYGGLSDELRDEIVRDLIFETDPEIVARHAVERWGLPAEVGEELAGVRLQSGYSHLSERAIKRLLPFLAEGHPYMGDDDRPGAVQLAGYRRRDEHQWERKERIDASDLPNLRNPIVQAALGQVRKVVNAIVAKHGVPDLIRVELARDLKNTSRDRERINKEQRARERENEEIRERLRTEFGLADPKRDDVLKYRLWVECSQTCPYTGQSIPKEALFGPDWEIEHILPYSRTLDDSFLNKSLCWAPENCRKNQRTPWETYGHNEAKWEELLLRLEKLDGMDKRKKRKFVQKELNLESFISRQLNDTRYISREVRGVLAPLVGGLHKVQVSKGQVTHTLRYHWGIDGLLSGGQGKTRDDHRHHAIDAITVALTTPGALRDLSTHTRNGRRARKDRLTLPWAGFRNDVQQAIDGIVVSHQVRRKLRGALHEETNYGMPKDPSGKQLSTTSGKKLYAVKKEIGKLKKTELEKIADPVVAGVIRDFLTENGVDLEKDTETAAAWKKAMEKAMSSPPRMPTRNGSPGPVIRKVRLHVPYGEDSMESFGYRAVKLGSNHHAVIWRENGKGEARYLAEVTSMFEAAHRAHQEGTLVRRNGREGLAFVMSLTIGESVLIAQDGQDHLCVVQKMSGAGKPDAGIDISFRLHRDARPASDVGKTPFLRLRSMNKWPDFNIRKVTVSPIGEVRPARD